MAVSADGKQNVWKQQETYEDQGTNAGVNTYDSSWNIGDNWNSGCLNIEYGITNGFNSAKAKVLLNKKTSEFGAYLTNVGICKELFEDNIVVAQSNGTETKIFFVDKDNGTVVSQLGAERFHASNRVRFTIGEDKIYMVDGDGAVRYVDSGAITPTELTASSGTIPVGASTIAFWDNCVWLANDNSGAGDVAASPNRITRSAQYNGAFWNTTISGSDQAWQIILDGSQTDTIQAMVPGALGSIVWIRKQSIYILAGTSPADYQVQEIPTDSGSISPDAVAKGTSILHYIAPFGMKSIKGAKTSDLESKFGTVETITATSTVKDIFELHTVVELEAAIGVVYNDKVRMRIGTRTYIFDLIANQLQGALSLGDIDIGLNGYCSDDKALYGVSKYNGFIYQLDTGYSDVLVRTIDTFGDYTSWTGTNCVLADDAAASHVEEGTNATEVTIAGAVTANVQKAFASINFTEFYSGKLVTDDDYYSIYAYIADISNLTSIEIRLELDASNYYSVTYPTLETGLNELTSLKSDFVLTGSLAWSEIANVNIVIVSSGATILSLDWLHSKIIGDYDKYLITKSHAFGYGQNIKNFHEIRVFGRTLGSYPVYCDYYIDDEADPRGTIEIQLDSGGAYYIFEDGTATSVGINFLTDTAKTWEVDEFVGTYLLDSASNLFLITANTTDTISVFGIPAAGAYTLVPTRTCFWIDDSLESEEFATFYGYSFTNIEDYGPCRDPDTGVGARGKRIKLKFYTTKKDQPFWIFKYQIVWEMLKSAPNMSYTRRVIS